MIRIIISRMRSIIILLIINWSFLQVNSNKLNRCINCVNDLAAESSFRTIKLNWNYYNNEDPIGFNVKFCELLWNKNVRCRERLLRLNNGRLRNKINILNKFNSPIESALNNDDLNNVYKHQNYDKLIRKNKHHYEAFIYDLRTLTNYTFQVVAEQFDYPNQAISNNLTSIQNLIKQNLKDKTQLIKNRPLETSTTLDQNMKSIQVETKGFSARTENCLSNSSDVIVNTGPLFNGKISVENSSSEECAVYGNRSAQEVYHLTIDHKKCNSRKNNSRIETMIIVHENKDILTHNARRFLVVCSFLPDSYTLNLKASVSMPTNLLRRKNYLNNQLPFNQTNTLYTVARVDPASLDNLFLNDTNDQIKFNEIRRSKLPTLINRIQRHYSNNHHTGTNHPGTLQEQFYKQKQQYLNNYLLNNHRLNNTELNNEIIYNFERLPKTSRDARFLNNQPQHSNVFNTQRERQSTQFQHYFTMIMVALGSLCLFVIIIFNFISIPKIWAQPHYHHRRKHHHHSHRHHKDQQENRLRKNREYRDYRLSLNKHYTISNSFNSLSSNVSSNVSSNLSSNLSNSPYIHKNNLNSKTPKNHKKIKQINRYSSSSPV